MLLSWNAAMQDPRFGGWEEQLVAGFHLDDKKIMISLKMEKMLLIVHGLPFSQAEYGSFASGLYQTVKFKRLIPLELIFC